MRMHANRKAVIDLGTNTFHLLIVDSPSKGEWEEIHRQREYVYLASSGMHSISDEAFARGIRTLKNFRNILHSKNVGNYKAIGTAALRTASNRHLFIQKVEESLDIEIEVIDGLQEAKYISRGVELAIGEDLEEYLIMDIGGGSVEFIHKSGKGIIWECSFPLGLAVIKSLEIYKDPLTNEVIQDLERHIHNELSILYDHLKKFPSLPLVGASGTFEALLQLISSSPFGKKCRHYNYSSLNDAFEKVKFLDISERLAHPAIPAERAELFSIATLLVYAVAKEIGSKDIYVSPYALKEGVLYSMK